MNGIDKMRALILSEAEAERDEKRTKANAEADELLAAYRSRANDLITAELEKARKEADAVLERAAASAHQTERNRLLDTRGALLDRAYANALDRLCSDERAKTADYFGMLKAIFDSVLAEELSAEKSAAENDLYGDYQAPDQYLLRLNERDGAALGAKLLKYANTSAAKAGKRIALDEKSAPIKGGFVLVCGDIELNCSLEQYMNRIRSATEGEVCGILFG